MACTLSQKHNSQQSHFVQLPKSLELRLLSQNTFTAGAKAKSVSSVDRPTRVHTIYVQGDCAGPE